MCVGSQGVVAIVLVLTVTEFFGGHKSIAASMAIVNVVQFNGSMGHCCQDDDFAYLAFVWYSQPHQVGTTVT